MPINTADVSKDLSSTDASKKLSEERMKPMLIISTASAAGRSEVYVG